MLIFLCETWCMLIFARETCCRWIISSGNLMYLDLCLRETWYIFISSSLNVLPIDFFLRVTCRLFFSYWIFYCSLNFLRYNFCSCNLIDLNICLCETYCMLFLSFMKVNLSSYFSSWNLFYVVISLKNLMYLD